jgi:repressor of nif and glnA expression
MKIRIKGNSIRFRLVKSEVKLLADTGFVEETTEFQVTKFTYRLKTKKNISELEADYSHNKITMFVPESEAKIWDTSDRISYKNVFGNLSLLLEKDFVCLDHTDEDQSDNYPNPNKVCS